MDIEQLPLIPCAVEKRPAQRSPQVTGAHLGGDTAHLYCAPGAAACQALAFHRRHILDLNSHWLMCTSPTRLLSPAQALARSQQTRSSAPLASSSFLLFTFSRTNPIDKRRRQGRTESVVNIHHGQAARAAIQHREQWANTSECGAIADTGRHSDYWLADQASHH